MPAMHRPYTRSTSPKKLLWRLLLLGSALLAMSWSLLADTPGRLKSTQTAGCYCHCSKGKGLGSCVKMCEMPKYASRWWRRLARNPAAATAATIRAPGRACGTRIAPSTLACKFQPQERGVNELIATQFRAIQTFWRPRIRAEVCRGFLEFQRWPIFEGADVFAEFRERSWIEHALHTADDFAEIAQHNAHLLFRYHSAL